MKLISSGSVVLLACAMLVTDSAFAQARGPSSRDIQENAKRAALKSSPSGPAEVADLEAWLERLKGHFVIKGKAGGTASCMSPGTGVGGNSTTCAKVGPASITYESEVECLGIGDGVGVRCVFKPSHLSAASLQRAREFDSIIQEGGSPNRPVYLLGPSTQVRALFGIDPVARNISVMTVGNIGGGSGGSALLEGDSVTIKGSCRNLAVNLASGLTRLCNYTLRIEAPPDGQVVRYWSKMSSVVPHGLSTADTTSGVIELHRVEKTAESTPPEAPPESQ